MMITDKEKLASELAEDARKIYSPNTSGYNDTLRENILAAFNEILADTPSHGYFNEATMLQETVDAQIVELAESYAKLNDIEEVYRSIREDMGADDEEHCACVQHLRRALAESDAKVKVQYSDEEIINSATDYEISQEKDATLKERDARVEELEGYLNRLKNNECWCDNGIGSPMVTSCDGVCAEITNYFQARKKVYINSVS